ncbi:MAG: SMC family ATPase, partial [Acidimicrobiia bacterium]
VRVVRRTSKGGATTAEARLESGGSVLASGAAELTQAVEGLIGLGIDHFTRSVVLPQGQFAAFLHDTPSGQQDLVKALLDMGVLDDVRRLASERSRTASALAESAQHRLDQLGDATTQAVKDAAARLSALEELSGRVAEAEADLGRAEEASRTAAAELEEVGGKRSMLAKVRRPDGVMSLSQALDHARDRVEETARHLTGLSGRVEELTEESERIPSLERLDATARDRKLLAEARLNRDAIDLEKLTMALAERREGVESAHQTRQEADARWESLRTRHAAHALTVGLAAGDPCPVCGRPLEEDPAQAPPDMEAAKHEVDRARQAVEEAGALHRVAESALAEGKANYQALTETIARLTEQLETLEGREDLEPLREARLDVNLRLESARQELKTARQADEEARRALEELRRSERQAWESFAACRDGVAALGPPPVGRDDLGAAWDSLMAWAGERGQALDEEVERLKSQAEERAQDIARQKEALESLLEQGGVGGSGSASARLAAATATARADHQRLEERRQERDKLESDRMEFEEQGAVARALGNHLRADRFQGWLMAEALATLVDGANSLLDDLSQGTYSLSMNDRVMEIVDHRNADERRPVRSLSGGETFLVSLALALSLGEQLTNLSGATDLDTIFLDEGFGTLDAETLETVSVVVTELSSRGRVVGLVTHVKELAEQVPVRFEVSPGPGGSTITRVDR